MYCTNCGQRLADDAKHCPNCGAPIVRDEARGENTYTNEQQAQEQPGYSYGAGQQARPEDGRTDYSYGQAPHERDPYAYSYAAPPAPTKEDSNALTGLILAIISAVCCCVPFIGLPCSIIAIVFAVDPPYDGNCRTDPCHHFYTLQCSDDRLAGHYAGEGRQLERDL